jgi:hypothetical protein
MTPDTYRIGVTQLQALHALRDYKNHRANFDARDKDVEKIYRSIARGNTVINARVAITRAGLNKEGLPVLALAPANWESVLCRGGLNTISFEHPGQRISTKWGNDISMPGASWGMANGRARLPRIPPQYRPAARHLAKYFILWEADWKSYPRDPFLLRRIGRSDAYAVVAAWDLRSIDSDRGLRGGM